MSFFFDFFDNKCHLLPIKCIILGNKFEKWGCLVSTSHFIRDDWRHLSLNWTNINQLFNRGSGTFKIMGTMFGTMIIGGISIFLLYTVTSTVDDPRFLNVVILGAISLLVVLYQLRIKKIFWDKIEG